MSTKDSRVLDRRTIMRSLAVVILLLGMAVGAWYMSARLTAPLSSGQGAETDGYRHVKSVYGNGSDRLRRPVDVAVDSRGMIYTTDSFKHRVMVFDSNGVFQRIIGGPAKVEGELKYPAGIEVDSRGRVYVTSKDPGKLVVFAADGKVLREVPVEDPLALGIRGEQLYVVTSKGILMGDLDGNQIGQLSGAGKEAGRLDRATGIAVDEQGRVFVADSLNYRFQALDKSGKSLWTLGGPPDPKSAVTDRNRLFGLPSGLTLGSDGLLYGMDAFNGQVIVLDRDGTQLAEYGEWGRQDGQFYYPTSLAEVSPELFVVADTFNDRLQFVGIPTSAPSLGIRAKRALPWLAPFALLLALIPLLRRRTAFITDADGLRRADNLVLLSDLIERAKVLYVPVGTAEDCAALIEQNAALAEVLREVEMDDLDDEPFPAVALADRMRGRLGLRRVALAFPNQEAAEAAAQLGIGVLEAEPRGEAVAAVS